VYSQKGNHDEKLQNSISGRYPVDKRYAEMGARRPQRGKTGFVEG
jgi:hypothetical protein